MVVQIDDTRKRDNPYRIEGGQVIGFHARN